MDYEHNKITEMDKRIRCSWSDTNNNQCERAGIRDGLCLYHFNNLKFIEMDMNQKELWRIAQDAYLSTTPFACRDWKAVADAVIAEHERRKAAPCLLPDYYIGPDGNGYGTGTGAIKPEWKLPDPPDGTEWHRTGWTAEMLPDGYRPLLLGENEERNDEFLWEDKKWANHPATGGARADDYHRRTTRPLPVKPDPFAAEKAAFAAGKTIQYYSKACSEWTDCNPHPPCWYSDFEYRVKPEPVTVPLGPDDVPPGSAIRSKGASGWSLICSAGVDGITTITDGPAVPDYDWSDLLKYEINRNDGKGWVPCSKIKTE